MHLRSWLFGSLCWVAFLQLGTAQESAPGSPTSALLQTNTLVGSENESTNNPSIPLGLTNQSGVTLPVITNFPSTEIGPLPASGIPGMPAGDRFGGTSQLASPPPSATTPMPGAQNPLQWGPVGFFPHLLYQVSYGDSLQPTPGARVNSWINQVSPGILLSLGSHWVLDYTPTLRFYTGPGLENGTDHAVSLNGRTTYGEWTFGLSQGYASTSQPLIETAAITSQQTFLTSLSASRPLGGHFSIDLGLYQDFLFLDHPVPNEALTDHRAWSTLDWLNYQVTPNLMFSVGFGFSYVDLATGTDLTSEQYQGRITWTIGHKLDFILSGGVSDMQFLGTDLQDFISPVFSLSARYQVFEYTTLFLGGSQTVSPSYFENQVSESTSLNGGINQRLFGHYYLDVSGAYGTSTYHASVASPSLTPVSNYDATSLNVALSTTFLTRATVSIFFAKTFVSSPGSAAYNYNTTQTGLTLGYRF